MSANSSFVVGITSGVESCFFKNSRVSFSIVLKSNIAQDLMKHWDFRGVFRTKIMMEFVSK